MPEELIVLVNEQGKPVGTAEKLATHHAHTPLHLAFSCYVFNDKGELLVTRRAKTKKVWPGVWSNTVCGHPAPDEDMVDAIQRRLREELGMTATDFKVVLPRYRYRTPPFNGVIENEFCPLYVARTISEPQPNPAEVADYKWVGWAEFVSEAAADNGNLWSWWCKDQIKQLRDNETIRRYVRNTQQVK